MARKLSLSSILKDLPSVWPEDLRPKIQSSHQKSGSTIVVLDDDPTGTQTVYDVPVLTEWSVENLKAELSREEGLIYILTNSRSVSEEQARQINREIATALMKAARSASRKVQVISRSDSTLRGHFPAEIDELRQTLNLPDAICVLAPFFQEGGRLTIGNVHYVRQGDELIPAASTPFAEDPVFGYKHSNLCRWVEEKTGGKTVASEVGSIPVEKLRRNGPEAVTEVIEQLAPGGVCIVNSAEYRDLEVAVAGLQLAEMREHKLIYRTAASFVKAKAGLESRPLLTLHNFDHCSGRGALIVVGSYVPRSSRQLETLLKSENIKGWEIPVHSVLNPKQRKFVLEQIKSDLDRRVRKGQDTVLYTSRTLVKGSNRRESLAISRQVSDAVVSIVGSLQVRPRYILAKGGITSSDLATRALGVKKARVQGQILPGIPVWKLGSESRYPDLDLIVFPGNVGEETSLLEVVRMLRPVPQSFKSERT